MHADLVITWAFAGRGAHRSSLLSAIPRLAGVGGYGIQQSSDGFQLAKSGFVVFDAHHIFQMSVRKQHVVALHELGHVLGLDDVHDSSDVMNAVVLDHGPSHYGSGDRAGLHRLGRHAGCLVSAPAPKPPVVVRSGNHLHITAHPVTSVSGKVIYALSSPELGGQIATATAPDFSMSLKRVGRSPFRCRRPSSPANPPSK